MNATSGYLNRKPLCREEVLAAEYRRVANMAEALDQPNQAQQMREWAEGLEEDSGWSAEAERRESNGRMQHGPR